MNDDPAYAQHVATTKAIRKEYDPREMKAARLDRMRIVADMEQCVCAWPLVKLESVTEHDPRCPVDLAVTAREPEPPDIEQQRATMAAVIAELRTPVM